MRPLPTLVLLAVIAAGLHTACGGRISDAAASAGTVGGAQSTHFGTGGVAAQPPTTSGSTLGGSTATASAPVKVTQGGAAGSGGKGTVVATGSGGVVACSGLSDDPASWDYDPCGATVETERLPLDLILLVDRSAANATVMAPGAVTRWDLLVTGMQAFASDPQAGYVAASLTLFGHSPPDDTDNCSAATYVIPNVGMNFLFDNGPAIVDSMQPVLPAGASPLVPALQGALAYAASEQSKSSLREKAVVLIGNGIPTECAANAPGDVIDTIQRGREGSAAIRTFVVGLGEPAKLAANAPTLTNYAIVGGTAQPFLIPDNPDSSTFVNQLASAMLTVAGSTTECVYELSYSDPTQIIDPSLVSLNYQPPDGGKQQLPRVDALPSCGASVAGGWYFDNPVFPAKVILCPCSCALVGKRFVEVNSGCRHGLTIE